MSMYSSNRYVFNILILMTIVSSISVHYLINPVLEISNSSISISTLTLIYPITNLSILFFTITLYYLSQFSHDRKVVSIVICGFFIQVFADSSFIYLKIIGKYQLGGIVDPLWLAAIMVIGLGGLVKQGTYNKLSKETNDRLKQEEILWPYTGVIFFAFIVLDSYQWNFNALSIGACIVSIIIIVRQLLIMKQNEKIADEYKYLAYHDPLTGLKNRIRFKKDLKQMLIKTHKKNQKFALILIDLDRFKYVNDTLGHSIGDCLLKKVSNRLKTSIGINASLYRLGGDEYIIILQDATGEYIQSTAESILDEFTSTFLVRKYEIDVTPSIGISVYPENGRDEDALFKSADMAMYLAKGYGKNNYQYYNTELHEFINRKVTIENELKNAIEKEQLQLFYQPKVDLYTRKVIGMEALIRWEHPDLGFISPAEFIPLAEETGEIVPIGDWVLKTACKQNKIWQENGIDCLCVSINVSVRQFNHSDFLNTVRNTLDDTGLSAEYLELEITESIIQNVTESKEILNGLRDMGVKVSIDDFGTGYSSLYVLRELPIDVLKIDKSFIDDLSNSKNLSMIKTIIELGLNLNLHVLAEGVENEYQANLLVDHNCSSGQGYLFSKPVSVEGFEELLMSHSS